MGQIRDYVSLRCETASGGERVHLFRSEVLTSCSKISTSGSADPRRNTGPGITVFVVVKSRGLVDGQRFVVSHDLPP